MDILELEKLAAKPGAEMPPGLTLGEDLLFLTLRELYNNFRSGAVNRERGRREKASILDAYRQVRFQHEMLEDNMKLRKRVASEIGSLHLCDCPTCRKVGRVFDGIERYDPTEDTKELQALADRLREMVKERSERNAELRTTIDRVKWIINGEGADADKLERVKELIANM